MWKKVTGIFYWQRPFGCFAQKAPVTFFLGYPFAPLALGLRVRESLGNKFCSEPLRQGKIRLEYEV